MKTTLKQQRSEAWDSLVHRLSVLEIDIKELQQALTELRKNKSRATGENRSFYRDRLNELAYDAQDALVRWNVLCALYDIIGDTKDRAW